MIQKKPISLEAATVRAENLCARAEYSTGEIRERLRRWGLPAADSERLISSLIARRFIDDGRFARAFVREKVEFARWGRCKIAAALYQKGIPSSLTNEALAEIDEEKYMQNLADLLSAKRRSLPDPDTYESRARLFRHAATRGYEPTAISKALSGK